MLRSFAIAIFILVVAIALYWESSNNGFHYDDYHSLVRNPHIRSLANLPRFFVDPSTFSVDTKNAMYRPVLLATYALNFEQSGLDARAFHLTNVLLHALNASLVFVLMLQLTGKRMLAAGSGLLFAVHPINSEAANYVSSRSELLMASFLLIACIAFLRHLAGTTAWYIVAFCAAAMSLLTKSVGAITIGAMACCHGLKCGWGGVRANWWQYLPVLVLPVAYVAIARNIVGKAVLEPVRTLDTQIWTQMKALVYYAFKTSVPVNLSVDPQFFPSRNVDDPVVLCAWLLVVSLAIAIIRIGNRILTFSWLWSLTVLLPAMLVPLIVLVNEHRLYVAAFGFSLIASWGFFQLGLARSSVAAVLGGLYLLAMVGLTLDRNQVWADELALWRDAAEKGPGMIKPHLKMGDEYAKLARWHEAESAYLKALEIRKYHPAARNNLGRLYMRVGRVDEAIVQFRELLAISPGILAARLNLAGAFMRKGKWDETRKEYEEVLQYDAHNIDALSHLGDIAMRDGDTNKALTYYNEALASSMTPSSSLLVRTGVAAKESERYTEAEKAYTAALAIDSTYADGWFNLGNLQILNEEANRAAESYQNAAKYTNDPALREIALQRTDTLKNNANINGG